MLFRMRSELKMYLEDGGYSVVKERECGELGLYFPVKEIEVGIIAVSLQVCDIGEIDDVNAIA